MTDLKDRPGMTETQLLPRLSGMLHYDPLTGLFTWKQRSMDDFSTLNSFRTWHSRFCGKLAGNKDAIGYWAIKICNKTWKGHRLAWMIMTGLPPPEVMDHINGNRSDNRWVNLRATTRLGNSQNTIARHWRTLPKGVYLKDKAYISVIRHNGKSIHLGSFRTVDDARAAYNKAAPIYHGEFARLSI